MTSAQTDARILLRRQPGLERVQRRLAPGLSLGSRTILLQVCAFTVLLATWMTRLGPVAPLLVMAATAGMLVLTPRSVLNGLVRAWPLLLVGAIAMGSFAWSTSPDVSLRYGLQLALTLLAAVVLGSALSPAMVLRAIFLSALAILVICLLSGRQGASASGPVLIGILGSKNEMGTLCQLLICCGVCLATSQAERRVMRVLGGLGGLLGTAVLLNTFATGAVLSCVLFMGLAVVFVIGSRLPTPTKIMLVVAVLALLAPLLLIRSDLASYWEFFVVDILGKDMGLTGRDYLWAHADQMIEERPVLGYGYRSTWLGSSVDTIGLLRWAGLTTGAGFNFHDTYREWAVDFGLLGAVVLSACFGVGLFRTISRGLQPGLTAPLVFFAATAVVLIVRAKVELVIGPFNNGTVLLGCAATLGYLHLSPKVTRPTGRRALVTRSNPAFAAMTSRAGRSPAPKQAGLSHREGTRR